MNKNKLIIFFLFFFFYFNIIQAAGKIAYIDIDFLLNKSLAGKSITKADSDVTEKFRFDIGTTF